MMIEKQKLELEDNVLEDDDVKVKSRDWTWGMVMEK